MSSPDIHSIDVLCDEFPLIHGISVQCVQCARRAHSTSRSLTLAPGMIPNTTRVLHSHHMHTRTHKHACAMPAREHRARMPCSSLRASYVCSRLLCFLVCIDLSPRLLAYGLLGGCAQAPLKILNIPPCPLSQAFTGHDHWGGTPLLNHGRAASTLTIGARQRLLWLTLFSPLAFACTAETILPPAQNYMRPSSSTHSHTPHGMSAHLIKLFRNIPLRVMLP